MVDFSLLGYKHLDAWIPFDIARNFLPGFYSKKSVLCRLPHLQVLFVKPHGRSSCVAQFKQDHVNITPANHCKPITHRNCVITNIVKEPPFLFLFTPCFNVKTIFDNMFELCNTASGFALKVLIFCSVVTPHSIDSEFILHRFVPTVLFNSARYLVHLTRT